MEAHNKAERAAAADALWDRQWHCIVEPSLLLSNQAIIIQRSAIHDTADKYRKRERAVLITTDL